MPTCLFVYVSGQKELDIAGGTPCTPFNIHLSEHSNINYSMKNEAQKCHKNETNYSINKKRQIVNYMYADLAIASVSQKVIFSQSDSFGIVKLFSSTANTDSD